MEVQLKKVALYARVSTQIHDQNPETQLLILRAWAKDQGYEGEEFVDWASAVDERSRKQWRHLMFLCLRPEPVFDLIVVTRWDRAFRSVTYGLESLRYLSECGVGMVAIHQGLDTSTPAGRMFLTTFLSFAEFERELTRERIMEGLQRARKAGKRLGRRPLDLPAPEELVQLVQKHGFRRAAKGLGISHQTLYQRLKTPRNGSEPARQSSLLRG